MADSDDNRWLPLREAIAEVAAVYHDALRGDYSEAREAAIDAIWHRLEYGAMISRAPTFYFAHQDIGKPELAFSSADTPYLPLTFWTWLRRASDIAQADWVIGDFSFHYGCCDPEPSGDPGQGQDCEMVYGIATSVSVGRLNFPFAGHDRPRPPAEMMPILQSMQRRRGRPEGAGGWLAEDTALVEKMLTLISDNPGMTPHRAAAEFMGEAAGNASLEVKQRRLAALYRKTHGG